MHVKSSSTGQLFTAEQARTVAKGIVSKVSIIAAVGFPLAVYIADRQLDDSARAISLFPKAIAPQIPDLLNAPVPASCEHPAGRLVKGNLPVSPRPDGTGGGMGSVNGLTPPVLTDLTRDGVKELVGVYGCTAGGVGWPQLILVYTAGPKLLGYVDLGDLVQTEHSVVKTMKPDGADLSVTWQSYEGAGFDMATFSGKLHWDGSQVVMTAVRKS
jgi:hypothetical protein